MLCLAALTAAGCSEVSGPLARAAPPALASARVDSVSLGATLRVGVDHAANVRVRYWLDAAPDTLVIETSVGPASSVVVLTRLRRGATYRYSVDEIGGDGAEGPRLSGSFSTPPLPPDLADLRFEPTGTPTDSILMLSPRGTAGFHGFVAVDYTGAVVWYWRTAGSAQGWTRRANGNFVLNDLGFGLFEVTPGGDLVRRLDYGTSDATPHHDLVATSQNTILFISQDVRTVGGDRVIWGEAIFEWAPESGQVTMRWTAWDWYDPSRDWGDKSTDADWLHANSLSLGPHGNIVLSLNWLSQVISIAPDWAHLEWRLGGETSTFAVDSAAAFSGQHAVSIPREGHVLMFDNGRDRPDGTQYSRGLEVALDSVTHVAHMVWEFRPAASPFAPYLGYAARLPNGNTEVFFGLPDGPFAGDVATGPISAYEVRPDGTVTWRLDVGNASSVYRGEPFGSVGGERVIAKR
jgi:hypothetical protein